MLLALVAAMCVASPALAADSVFWSGATNPGSIRVGNLSGGGAAASLFTGESVPTGVAIDPTAGKIYWAANGSGVIRVANLDGTGTAADLFTEASGTFPTGVAIDPTAGKIYWANQGSGELRVGNLTGGGAAAPLFTGETNPFGVAIDPTAGKIYWTDLGSGQLRVGNLDGTGTAADLFTGETNPFMVALLRSPVGTAVPAVSGDGQVGQPLECSQGSWAADLLGSFLYRAPRTFAYQWLKNGALINSATTSTYTPTAGGSYSCRVTAANQAGGTPQTSSPRAVAAGALTALRVSPATFKLTGRKVKGRCVKLTAKNNNHPHCKRPIKLHVTYTLDGAATVTFTLKRKTPGRTVKGHCVTPTKKNQQHKRCSRLVNVRGTITQTGTSGANTFTFNGKIGGHKLVAAIYQLIATTAGGSRNVKLRIVR